MKTKTVVTLITTTVLLGGLFLILKPDAETGQTSTTLEPTAPVSATPSANPNTFLFLVSGGTVTAPQSFSVTQGAEVTIRVTADVADTIHLHGYDLSKPTAPGQPIEIRFVASTAGRFEIELEQAALTLGILEVQPK